MVITVTLIDYMKILNHVSLIFFGITAPVSGSCIEFDCEKRYSVGTNAGFNICDQYTCNRKFSATNFVNLKTMKQNRFLTFACIADCTSLLIGCTS